MKYILIGIIKLYRLTLSENLPPACRFMPSCSAYALCAVERFGAVRGGYLAFRRILRCNPFHIGGWDPVPAIFHISYKKILKENEENEKFSEAEKAASKNETNEL